MTFWEMEMRTRNILFELQRRHCHLPIDIGSTVDRHCHFHRRIGSSSRRLHAIEVLRNAISKIALVSISYLNFVVHSNPAEDQLFRYINDTIDLNQLVNHVHRSKSRTASNTEPLRLTEVIESCHRNESIYKVSSPFDSFVRNSN